MIVDWSNIRLVVFDLDGTLYDQVRLRRKIARELAKFVITRGSLKPLRIIRNFRNNREKLAEADVPNFIEEQFRLTARQCHCSEQEVKEVVAYWIYKAPLPLLMSCAWPGVFECFEALHRTKRQVAIFSDYPAIEKLSAMGLTAQIVISADDPEVGRLKPNPSGLKKILHLAGTSVQHSLMVGDRFDRDWAAANRIGMKALIRSSRPDSRGPTFVDYRDPCFKPLLEGAVPTC